MHDTREVSVYLIAVFKKRDFTLKKKKKKKKT